MVVAQYFIMLLVQKCIIVYVRKLTPRQVMNPWAKGLWDTARLLEITTSALQQ